MKYDSALYSPYRRICNESYNAVGIANAAENKVTGIISLYGFTLEYIMTSMNLETPTL
jgi:hypothetical protein